MLMQFDKNNPSIFHTNLQNKNAEKQCSFCFSYVFLEILCNFLKNCKLFKAMVDQIFSHETAEGQWGPYQHAVVSSA